MSYYYRGYRRGRYWGAYHVSKRRHLTNLFGGIDQDIERAFFALSSSELEALFMVYGRQYGKSAEAYARRTYPQWKSGAVKLSGQTAERLLELLPPRLSKEQRYELIRKLRKHYLKRTNEYVATPPETWRQRVIPAVEKVIRASRDFKLPQELYEKATWLTDGDTQAVHRILHSIEEEEARQRTAYLDAEFKRIEVFVANIKTTDSASHTISIPQGDINVTIQKEKRPTQPSNGWPAPGPCFGQGLLAGEKSCLLAQSRNDLMREERALASLSSHSQTTRTFQPRAFSAD